MLFGAGDDVHEIEPLVIQHSLRRAISPLGESLGTV
jgi:hypothetical protein